MDHQNQIQKNYLKNHQTTNLKNLPLALHHMKDLILPNLHMLMRLKKKDKKNIHKKQNKYLRTNKETNKKTKNL